MRQKIITLLKHFIEPRVKKLIIAVCIPILVVVTDILTGYCTEDMCFSGIHRFSSDMNIYFTLANIEKYFVITMFSYVLLSLAYGGVRIIIRKIAEEKTS
jgi:hypothetical protein